jgi:phosphate transport system substrate-binding protein
VGVSAEGNEGVAAEVKATSGAIGYVELSYARQNRLAVVAVQEGKDKDFVLPGADEPNYPIRTRTWLVLDPSRLKPEQGKPLVSFIKWALHDGASVAHDYEYSPLESDTVTKYDELLDRVDFVRCAKAVSAMRAQ